MIGDRVSKQSGFTLLELLIVLVIIAILALLIVPGILLGPKKDRDAQRKRDLQGIKSGLEQHFVSNNIYPSSLNDLTNGNPPILKPIPNDPKNTGTYVYTYTPANTNTTYTLKACLENGNDTTSNTLTDPSCTDSKRSYQLVNTN